MTTQKGEKVVHAEFRVGNRKFLALRQRGLPRRRGPGGRGIVSIREFRRDKDGREEYLVTHSMGEWDYDARRLEKLRVELVSRETELDADSENSAFLAALTAGATAALKHPRHAAWLDEPEGAADPTGLRLLRRNGTRYAGRALATCGMIITMWFTGLGCQVPPPPPQDFGVPGCTPCSQTLFMNGCPPSICLPVGTDAGVAGLCCDWSRLNP